MIYGQGGNDNLRAPPLAHLGTVQLVGEFRYASVHEDLIAAFPELREPYRRLFDDWDDFEGEPPGQYIVFSDTFGTMLSVALALPEGTSGREDVLRQALEFGEELLATDDLWVYELAIDAVAESLDVRRGGPELARRLGGPLLRDWFDTYSRNDWKRPASDDIVDLWGVREAISGRFPETPPHELPGISYPSVSPDLESLDAARASENGVVLLAANGTNGLLAAIRASEVRAEPAALDALAVELAGRVGGDLPEGDPRAHFRRIPPGERVWNMHRRRERHTRLWHEPWVHRDLRRRRRRIVAALRGEF